ADPATLTGLHIITNSSESGRCRYAARYPAIPGADALTDALGKAVQADIDRFAGSGGSESSCDGGQDQPELSISFEILQASGDVAAVRLTTLDYTAAGSGLSTTTYWYDGATHTSPANAELFTGQALKPLATRIKEQLAHREGADPALLDQVLATDSDTADALRDVSFTANGDLAIDFDRGAVAVPPAGAQHIEIPRTDALSLLSDFGRRTQQLAVDPSPGLDLGVTPTADTAPIATPAAREVNCRKVKCLALTFDDGPGPHTKRLLEILAENDAHATFFLVGQNVRTYRTLTRAELDAGHQVGNHTWDHADLTHRKAADVRSEISRTNQAITSATGTTPTLVRPPYGAVNTAVRRQLTMPIILWSVDTEDWKHHDSSYLADYTIRTARPGDIVLFHDIHATSVAAIPRILRTLTARGYHFVTLTQLYGNRKLRAGITYHTNEQAYGR
ncbi:MAG TPA: polysaccharide deacetylase family protein, partial [Kineosporiaceae bacterium]|nr:polysaccharide deacetylase family protein [Kineosporiaceae bacterium]